VSMPLHQLDRSAAGGGAAADVDMATMVDTELLRDRNKAFELFRKSYRRNEAIEENKQILKDKFAQAKALAAQVNQSRNQINYHKSTIEQLRKERAMHGLLEPAAEGEEAEVDPEEERNKAAIEGEKAKYKAAYTKLKSLKAEIEHLQLMLEKSRKRLQKDFENWRESGFVGDDYAFHARGEGGGGRERAHTRTLISRRAEQPRTVELGIATLPPA